MDRYNNPKSCDRILKSIQLFRLNLPIPVRSSGHEIKRAIQTDKDTYPSHLIGLGTDGKSVAIEVTYSYHICVIFKAI